MSGTDQSPKRAQLRLLGGFDLHSAEGCAAIPAGRKVRALLTCLALSPGQAWPREKLMALLWGDRGDEQARASLRQALAEMRRVLGEPSPVRAEHDAVSLDPALLAVDALEFERLAKAGKLDEAAALYRGPLLDGHGVRDGVFEDWIRVERTRLHDLAVDVLDRLAGAQSGDAALETAQRLLQLDPAREETHRLLMRLYAAAGQRAQALRQYEHCRDVLKRDLQAKPDAETERLHRQIQSETTPTPAAGTGAAKRGTAMERRLAAILAADVVGYSRLMGADDEGTLATLSTYRDVVDSLIAEHQGHVFGSAGDSVVAEFGSAVQSVRCAVAIQRAINRRNADLPDRQRMEFRIGVNLGDIMVQNDNLFGDGVNVAARSGEVADPSDICISSAVYDQIAGKVSFPASALGERIFKNIARPVSVYRVDWRLEDMQATEILSGNLSLPDKPSVAILPFVNMSGDAEQEYFADGITEDIITALSRNRWFFVIARNSTFTYKKRAVDVKQVARELGVRYVLEGSVRKAGNRIRINTQLIEADSGAHLWVERYDRDLSDVFALQDEITESVVAAIEPELLVVEGRRAARKSAAHLDAYDLFLRGMWHYYQFNPEDNRRAEDCMRKAMALDPRLAHGHLGLARVLNGRILLDWSTDVDAEQRLEVEAAQRAVELDDKDPYCHYVFCLASRDARMHQRALAEAQRAIDLNPNFALAYYALGSVRVYVGHFAEAIDPLLRCMRLSPNEPIAFISYYFLGLAHYHQHDYEQAVQLAHRGLALRRIYPLYRLLVASLGQLGRLDEAAAAREDMERLGAANVERLWRVENRYVNPADFEHFCEGLKKAGILE